MTIVCKRHRAAKKNIFLLETDQLLERYLSDRPMDKLTHDVFVCDAEKLEMQSQLKSNRFLDRESSYKKSLHHRSASDKKKVAPIDAKRLSSQTKKSWKRAPAHPSASDKQDVARIDECKASCTFKPDQRS